MQFLHFKIRPLEYSDLESFYKLVEANRSRLEDFFTGTTSRTKTYEETASFVSEMIEKRKGRIYFPYIIVDLHNESIVGFLDLKNIDWKIPKAELGCYIDQKSEGKGITSQAVALFCSYSFEEYGFKKMFLRTHESNISARSVAEKCGFQLEGKIRRDYMTTSGEIVDLMYYGRLNDE